VKRLELLIVAAFFMVLVPGIARADDYVLTIRDHHFSPAAMTIPAGQKVKLTVVNQDATPEEFESYELNREKVVDGNSRIIVFVGPLDAGTYPYFGDFHKDLANGQLVAK
jgi:plastocyanin